MTLVCPRYTWEAHAWTQSMKSFNWLTGLEASGFEEAAQMLHPVLCVCSQPELRAASSVSSHRLDATSHLSTIKQRLWRWGLGDAANPQRGVGAHIASWGLA